MNAFVKKEIRLVLPGFVAGLLIVSAVWLLPRDRELPFPPQIVVGSILVCALALMALGTFGREFSGGTFSMLMSQPVKRARLWRVKIGMLAAMMACVWLVWCASCLHRIIAGGSSPAWLAMFLFALAIFSGALWTVLLVRQVAAALWFTILFPVAIRVFITNLSDDPRWRQPAEWWSDGAMLAYGVGGFFFARWLFARAQDLQWTGGDVRMPAVGELLRFRSGMLRKCRPNCALLWKELQLHQSQFLMAGVLLLFHIGTLVVRRFGTFGWESQLRVVLETCWVLWLLMPLIIGCAAAAEERKMGTLASQLCLPVKPRTQFAWKFSVAIGLSVLFGAMTPLLLEIHRVASGEFFKTQSGNPAMMTLYGVAGALILSLYIGGIAFYVSTLSRNTLQALAPAVLGVMATAYMLGAAVFPERFIRVELWRGLLVYLIVPPMMAIALTLLAYWNFKQLVPGWKTLRMNLLMLPVALVIAMGTTAAVYHRTWELLTPIEPRRNSTGNLLPGQARLHFWQGSENITVILPDGRAWVGTADRTPANLYTGQFLNGDNWADLADCGGGVVGIHRDGTLWISGQGFYPIPKTSQVGNGQDWKSLYAYNANFLFLLKTDGTLWCWENAGVSSLISGTLGESVPVQLGTDSDWSEIFSSSGAPCFRKTNGETWSVIVPGSRNYTDRWSTYTGPKIVYYSDLAIGRIPEMDHERWKDLFGFGARDGQVLHIGLTEDGVLREQESLTPREFPEDVPAKWKTFDPAVPMGNSMKWLKALEISFWQGVYTLKPDGSLWQWDFKTAPDTDPHGYSIKPLGRNTDWVDISPGSGLCEFYALASDGSLWRWSFETPWSYDGRFSNPLLQISRRPQLLGNIFDAAH